MGQLFGFDFLFVLVFTLQSSVQSSLLSSTCPAPAAVLRARLDPLLLSSLPTAEVREQVDRACEICKLDDEIEICKLDDEIK